MARRKSTTTALVPAAARAPEVFSDIETELNVRAVEQFTAQLGGRDALAGTLAIGEGDPAVEKVLTYLLDPRYDRWPLRKICRLAGLTVVDLFTAYKRAAFAKAHIASTQIVTAALPPIVADVMTRATPQAIVCPVCAATPTTRPTCPVCKGTGVTTSEPELERQKLALELGHLTEKKGGIVMQQNTITAASAALSSHAPGALEQLQQVVGDLIFSPRGRPRRDEPLAEPDPGDPDGSGEIEPPLPFEEHEALRQAPPLSREPWAPGDPEPD